MPQPLPPTSNVAVLPDISDVRRALLEKYLSGAVVPQPVEARVIPRRAADQPPQPSLGQEQLWIHSQLVTDQLIYNEPVTVRRLGALDLNVLKRCLNEIIRRHEAWRTNFSIQDGQLVQVINPAFELELPVVDLRQHPASDRDAEALRLATEDCRKSFNLAEGPLLRALLIRLADDEHRLYLTLHQIIFDGVSLYNIFLPELAALYDAFAAGQVSPLAEPAIQYADFAAWQHGQEQEALFAGQLNYWRRQLAGAPAALELPLDRPRPAVQTFNGRQLSFTLPQQVSEALKTLSRREGTTLFMTLLAAFQIVLQRYSNQDDLVVGTVTTSRKRSELDELLGFFLNTLVLRTDVSGNPTFRELLARVRQVTVDALSHGDVPVPRLVKELDRERDPSRNPLFQVMFVLEPPLPTLPWGWELSQVDVDAGIARVDLYLELDDRPAGLVGRIRYNSDLFAPSSIDALLDHLRQLLSGIVADPDRAIADYALGTPKAVPPATSRPLRPTNSFTEFARSEIEQSIAARFESQVAKHPAQTAVRTRNSAWSYAELDQKANEIAQTLLHHCGAGAERVALLFDHDAPMIAALIGSLKAGKTYVPLDPASPVERLGALIADAEATALITDNKHVLLAREIAGQAVTLINTDQIERPAKLIPTPDVAPDQPAYILYTSGSTGKPKGVIQNQRNVLHYIRVYTNNLHIASSDRLSLLSSYCFDAAVMDIYGALLNGATLCLVDLKAEGLTGLARRLENDRITIYHSTPTVYRYFINSLPREIDFSQIRLVVLGGEEVKRSDVELYKQQFPDECLFVNGLGPTEATVTLQNFIDKRTEISGESVPVGYPVEATEVLLLDNAGHISEVFGEIAIRSEHVALGYWQNPEATAAAFSPTLGPERIYRTGDLGRRLADGRLKFEGRKDLQIKIRGFRVELGEIESTLVQHELVRECAVVARETKPRDQTLVAYVVRHTPGTVNGELRSFLKQRLPEYMVPSSFVVVDSLPLTASGKINRLALPDVPLSAKTAKTSPAANSKATLTETEEQLLKIWLDLLGSSYLDIDDNFFEAGGHSLMAVRLFAQIEKRFDQTLPLSTLFKAPTIAQLAAILDQQKAEAEPDGWSSLVAINPINPHGHSKPPFFCVHALGGNVLEYYDLARYLGADQPFYGLQSVGLDGKQQPHTRVEEMATHYLKEIRTVQAAGPYFIGGRSLGGMIAFEMARQLRAQGEQVGLLALLDTYPSGYAKLLREQSTWRGQLGRAIKRTKAHLTNLQALALPDKLLYLAAKSKFAPRKLKSQVWRRVYNSFQRLGRPLPRALQDIQELNSHAVRNYVPQLYEGHITLFWASSDLRTSVDLVGGWHALAGGGIDVKEIPGSHLDIIKEPHVAELALKLGYCLAQSQARQTTTAFEQLRKAS